MNNDTTDYKRVISELIKKQILVLGPDITLAKVKNVQGIVVTPAGDVESISGDPKVILQKLIDSFVELSGLIVRKTMESILPGSSGLLTPAQATTISSAMITKQNGPQEKKAEAPLSLQPEEMSISAIQEDEPVTKEPEHVPVSADGEKEIEGKSAEAHQSAIDEALASLGEVSEAKSGQTQPFSNREQNQAHPKLQAEMVPKPEEVKREESMPQIRDFSSLKNIQGGI